MTRIRSSALATAAAVLALGTFLALEACGSPSGSPSTSSPGAPGSTTAGKPASKAEKPPQEGTEGARNGKPASPTRKKRSHGSGSSSSAGGARAFETPGGDNSIEESGTAGSGTELKQAAAVLHAYLNARAGEDWSAACSNMAAGVTGSLQQAAGSAAAAGGRQGGCEHLIASLSAGMPKYLREELATAEVGALRVTRGGGFLLFHGAHQAAYFMPMVREGGRWKVAALAASALP